MKKKKKKKEASKVFCAICLIVTLLLASYSVVLYGINERTAIVNGSGFMPSATLPVILIESAVGFYLSYLGYNSFLKNSRNKYQVDANGEPYQQLVERWVNEKIKEITKQKGAKRNDTHG